MPKRPDYGDATPEDLALALMRFDRAPLKKHSEFEQEGSERSAEQCDEAHEGNNDV